MARRAVRAGARPDALVRDAVAHRDELRGGLPPEGRELGGRERVLPREREERAGGPAGDLEAARERDALDGLGDEAVQRCNGARADGVDTLFDIVPVGKLRVTLLPCPAMELRTRRVSKTSSGYPHKKVHIP